MQGTPAFAVANLNAWWVVAFLSCYPLAGRFGGIKGEPMDMSSFNGGNVKTWDTFWPSAAPASFFWHSIFNTPERQSCGASSSCPWAKYLPIPGVVEASYAQSGHILLDQLGANSLWREWYRLPSSQHLAWWPKVDLFQPLISYCAPGVEANATSCGVRCAPP